MYVLPNKKGLNVLRWLWLSTNLFNTVKFHDVQAAIDEMAARGGGTENLLPGVYIFPKALILRDNVGVMGAGFKETFVTKWPMKTGEQSPLRDLRIQGNKGEK